MLSGLYGKTKNYLYKNGETLSNYALKIVISWINGVNRNKASFFVCQSHCVYRNYSGHTRI